MTKFKHKIITEDDVGKMFTYVEDKNDLKRKPKFSIVILNLNMKDYLTDCFNSIFNQSYQNIEVLFVDDCSSDNSIEVAQKFNKRYPDKIFISRNPKPKGITNSFHTAWVNIRGEFFVVIKPDVILEKDFISKLVPFFVADEYLAFTVCETKLLDSNNNEIKQKPFFKKNIKFIPSEFSKYLLYRPVVKSVSQIVYRKNFVEERAISRGKVLPEENHINRIVNIHLSIAYPIVYVKEELLTLKNYNLIETQPENLDDVIVNYCLNTDILELVISDKKHPLYLELNKGFKKISFDCVVSSINSIESGDFILAKRYYHMALSINPKLKNDKNLDKIINVIETKSSKPLDNLKNKFLHLKNFNNSIPKNALEVKIVKMK